MSCRDDGIELGVPTTPAETAEKLAALREGLGQTEPIQISGVSSPIPNLYPYIRHADLECAADIHRLNTLDAQIREMTQEEQRLFSGALELERSGSLDDAIHIAEGLERYEIFPKIRTDEELGRFLVETAPITGKYLFPEAIRPYLDYAKIGAEQRSALGGVYTPHGLVKRREKAPIQAETPRAMLLTLAASGQDYPLVLPASEQQMDHAKRALGIEDFSQAAIAGAEYAAPYLSRLIPMDGITVEGANELAHCLQRIKADGEVITFCAALEAEQPDTFPAALNIAMNQDDYEQVPEDMDEYGKQVLRRTGADDEVIDTIDGYMDFSRLGEAIGDPGETQRSGFAGERRSNAVSEPCRLRRGEGYGVCDDEGRCAVDGVRSGAPVEQPLSS